MRKIHVVTFNQDTVKDSFQLPSSCKKVTGVFVTSFCKTSNAQTTKDLVLSFPQNLVYDIAENKALETLHYMLIKTRATEVESKTLFSTMVLPVIVSLIRENLIYEGDNAHIGENIALAFENDFVEYLFTENDLYAKGIVFSVYSYLQYVSQQIVKFIYQNKNEFFKVSIPVFDNLQKETSGSVTLLLNGNNFILRDYYVTTNRAFKSLKDELIPLNEVLLRNSDLAVVYKHLIADDVTVKVYVQYETEIEEEVADDE